MELWDAYDRNWQKTGETLVRGPIQQEGIYHLVVGILVQHVDGTCLLMQRHPQKETWPGVYEASAGGSVLAGEEPLDAARRELYEETGIRAEALLPLYEEIKDEKHSLYRGYLCVTDHPKDQVILQEGETVAYRWATPGEMRQMMAVHPPVCVFQKGVQAYLGLAEQLENEDFRMLRKPVCKA